MSLHCLLLLWYSTFNLIFISCVAIIAIPKNYRKNTINVIIIAIALLFGRHYNSNITAAITIVDNNLKLNMGYKLGTLVIAKSEGGLKRVSLRDIIK